MTKTHSGGGFLPRTLFTAPALGALLVLGLPAVAPAAAPSAETSRAPVAAIAKAALPAIVDIKSIEPMPQAGGKPGKGDEGAKDQGSGSHQAGAENGTTPKPGHPGNGQAAPKGDEATSGSLIEPPRAEQALGTGFLIDSQGYIVTNHHVIAKAKEIRVTFKNGSIYPAKVVGVDKKADLAVLKIDAGHKLPHLDFGNSRKLQLGDPVVAIGNPFGLGFSISSGVVSALHRDIQSGPYDDFIQTDAAINRGNSGGPLLDAQGKVIGIDTAIYSPSGGSVGIGFAIPASMVKPVAEQLIAHGKMRRGWAGIDVEHVSDAMRRAWHLPSNDGAVVAGVAKDGPSAGKLKPGEIVQSVNAMQIADTHEFKVAIAEIPVGGTAKLGLWHDGKTSSATITIAKPPHREPVTKTLPKPPPPAPVEVASLGIRVVPHPEGNGLAIVQVAKGSIAARAGLKQGMRIEAVGADFVTTPDGLRKALKGEQQVLLLVTGEHGPSWLEVALSSGKAAPSGKQQEKPEQKRD